MLDPKSRCLFGLMLICCMTSGCNLTLGPVTRQVYTIVYPGKPLQIVENQVITGKIMDGTSEAPVKQNVGGWVVMPIEHFAALQRAAGIAKPSGSEVK